MINQTLTQYPAWRLWPVHLVAKLFGVLVKVDGFPFGSDRRYSSPSAVGGSAGASSSSAQCAGTEGEDADAVMNRKLSLAAAIRAAQERQRIFDAAINAAAAVARRTSFNPKDAAKDVALAGLAINEVLKHNKEAD